MDFSDIRRSLEEQLHSMRTDEDGGSLLRATLDLVPDLIVLKDRAGRWLFANKLVLETHGLTEEQCLNRTDLELILLRPEHREVFEKNTQSDLAAWEAGRPLRIEKTLPGTDGSLQYWEVVKTPIFDERRRPKCLIVVSRNITERIISEKALLDRELQYRLIANHMTDIVSMLKPDGEIVYVSPSLERVLGHSPERFYGIREFPITHPEDLDNLYSALQNASEHRRRTFRDDIRLLHRCGIYMWFEIAVSFVEQGEGQDDYLLVTARDISVKKDYELQLQSMAFRDSLTGISNRRHLMDRLEAELEKADSTGIPFALLYLDVDKFKEINDTLGHAAGDELLLHIAERIGKNLRESDLVARLGGDEFVVLLPETGCSEQIAAIADRICSVLGEPWHIGGHEFTTTSSLGIALYPQHGRSSSELLHCADRALYAAKREGRARTQFYRKSDESGAAT
ncbi:sensor domain-containing diguanylate cyclase [Saccharibacillus alkalitolerans]|uniref:Sensor domain-containing diguanylate cyclase n=1 Tax=Saccharibacillus alkalitolerans TaxID=2705290 RepID=A0ABX0F2D4_9BACL|nr:sensor domain-containing diguanylate cyclase [Saccharibacillus alkalitolerans]NGZ74025.1 sensor domain-containing diguanylate cyclase [Saccharibacillus alkalitolerans]